jgi:hypothetical protein
MLITHKVSPSELLSIISEDRSKRAKFRASPRLTSSRRARRVLSAVERYGIFHITNIAVLRINFRVSAHISVFRKELIGRVDASATIRLHQCAGWASGRWGDALVLGGVADWVCPPFSVGVRAGDCGIPSLVGPFFSLAQAVTVFAKPFPRLSVSVSKRVDALATEHDYRLVSVVL